MIGRRLGEFVIREPLGAGGGGQVFLAQQTTLSRDVVIKVLRLGEGAHEGAVGRFLREARLASQLDHPFAAHVYGFGHEPDGTLWIAMELVRGTPLNQMIKERPIPLSRFVPFFDRLCEVLHAAHEQGVVHRDVKPANVMVLNRSGRLLPKLLDLGIARKIDTSARSDDGPRPWIEPDLSEPSGPLGRTIGEQLVDSETASVTEVGVLVGTPQYMAPEQWVDAARLDARSDIYSLALLAYHAITGRHPFPAASLKELARAHGRSPLPPLPEELPTALHRALSQGAAKAPADRPATALELAASVRASSGVGTEPVSLPQLDEGTRETVLTQAPQPIAEAVALLEGARTARAQSEALATAVRAIAQYLGVLALASRARLGGVIELPEARAALEALARDRLSPLEWVRLACDLCRPYARRPGAHPLPELVGFFFDQGSAGESRSVQALADLCAPAPQGQTGEVSLAHLVSALAKLGGLLKQLSFLSDYSLTVMGKDPERWMGARRPARLPQRVKGPPPPAGVAFLIDPDAVPVLVLHPLAQVIAPGAGLAEELFLLDGAGRHGARLVALPGPFERQSDQVWPWFSEFLVDVGVVHSAVAAAERPPYKGLATFTPEDADNYFGRELEAESFANRLRLTNLLAVVGPSGAGKSSFVLAGVLPLMPAEWRAVVMRPGATPWAVLSSKLAAAGLLARSDAEGRPTPTASALLAALPPEASLVIVVDQFEELITLCPDARAREEFSRALVELADQGSGRIKVIVTLRDDFLIRVQQLPPLRQRLSAALQLLGTPAKEDLVRVLTKPAAKVGYGFDDDELPVRMVEEVANYPGALALLSFAASQLWDLRDRQVRHMRSRAYQALGGVGGALAQHAESTFAALTEQERLLAREAFRHLVTSQGTRSVLSKDEVLQVLGGSGAAASVVEKLVGARLLVTSEDLGQEIRVEIIHEALLTSWPRLVGWQREDAETARLRDALRASARQWEERQRPKGLLWRKEALAEYRVWRARFPGKLTASEEAFGQASLADERRGQRIRRGLAATAFVGVCGALALVTAGYRAADQALLTLRQEQARLALLDSRPLDALTYLARAARDGADSMTLRRVAGFIQWQLRGFEGDVASRSVPGRRLVSLPERQGLVAQWDDQVALLEDAGVSASMSVKGVASVVPLGGARVALLQRDGVLKVLDLRRGLEEQAIPLGGLPMGAALVADGGLMVAQVTGKDLHVDLATSRVQAVNDWGEQGIHTLRGGGAGRWAASFAGGFEGARAQGVRIVGAGGVQASAAPQLLVQDAHFFYRSDEALLIGARSGEAGVWSLSKASWVWTRSFGAAPVTLVRVAPNDAAVAIGTGRLIHLCAPETGKVRLSDELSSAVIGGCFSPSGNTMMVLSTGGELRAYGLRSFELQWVYWGHAGVVSQCVLPSDEEAFTISQDGSVKRWNLAVRSHDGLVATPEPKRLWVGAASREIVFWAGDGVWVVSPGREPERVLRLEANDPEVTAMSATSELVAIGQSSGITVVRRGGGEQVVARIQLTQAPYDIALASDGTTMVVVESEAGPISLRETYSGAVRQSVEAREMKATSLRVDDGTKVWVGTMAGETRQFDFSASPAASAAPESAHRAPCWVVPQGASRRSYSLDGTVVSRGPQGSRETLDVQTAISAAAGEVDVVLRVDGTLVAFSGEKELARMRTRAVVGGQSVVFSGDTLWYIGRDGRLAHLTPPPEVSPTELQALWEARAISSFEGESMVPRRGGRR